MPVKVKCSNCDKSLSVPDAARGKAVKCPQCDTRISIPAGEVESKPSSKAKTAKPSSKKSSKPADSEEALATFDMRRAEDSEARICSKCGHDMKYQAEDDTECPTCGYDSASGGLGAKARKKAMKGPDPADFYPGLFNDATKFVIRNINLAFRTVSYTLICLTVSLACSYLYLWISAWPPRWFLILCFTISFLVIPGWMLFLDTEVIKLTLERKDKFKKLNFDFFLSSAMGLAFVFWTVAVVIPVAALPAGLGYVLVNYGGMPETILPIFAGIGATIALWMLPVSVSHMTMPVQYKGWLVWLVVPMWVKNIKPLTVWFMFFLVTNIPNIAGFATIAAVSGQEIVTIVKSMEFNAAIERKKAAGIDNPNARKKGQAPPVQEKLPDLLPVNLMPLILPCVILAVMSVINGFTSIFNMRTNGQFTYYFKNSLDLVDKLKEKRYKAKEKRDEDEEEQKPQSVVQMAVNAFVLVMVFDLMGFIFGGGYGYANSSVFQDVMAKGIFFGLLSSHTLALMTVTFQNIKLAFETSAKWGAISLFFYPLGFCAYVFQDWEERKEAFILMLMTIIPHIALVIWGLVAGFFVIAGPAAVKNEAPQVQSEQVHQMTLPQPGQPVPGNPPQGH